MAGQTPAPLNSGKTVLEIVCLPSSWKASPHKGMRMGKNVVISQAVGALDGRKRSF